jgi:hypothetical protein
MPLATAVALLALLVALIALLGLVAVYGRLRQLEAGDIAGYSSSIGRRAPDVLLPRGSASVTVVAVLDDDCALCHTLWAALAELSESDSVRVVGLGAGFACGGNAQLLDDATVRGALFEGYAPTVLTVDHVGLIITRRFIYPDTDLPTVLRELTGLVMSS